MQMICAVQMIVRCSVPEKFIISYVDSCQTLWIQPFPKCIQQSLDELKLLLPVAISNNNDPSNKNSHKTERGKEKQREFFVKLWIENLECNYICRDA